MDTVKYCDFGIICRICLSKSDKTYFTDAAILNVIHKLTDLDFRTDDLPQQICQKCLDKINDICEFSFQCIRSHSAFIECLNQQKKRETNKATVDVPSYDIPDEYENHINEDEIIESLDKLETEEPKEHNVKEVTTNIKIIESENKISVNHDERPYRCGICCKDFVTKSRLKQHKPTHSGERPYKCSQCSKSFSLFGTLVRHKRTHSGERPYKCGLCSKSFAHATTLKQHKRIHTGERPFKCDLCSKAFSQASALVYHKYVHGAERPHKCGLSSKTFTQKSRLVQHERNRHNGKRLKI